MVALGWATPGEAAAAVAEPIAVAQDDPLRVEAPWFAQAAAVEAAGRYGVDVLRESGLTVESTLDWLAQKRAERAVARGLARLDGAGGRGAPLEAALVSLDPADGSIRAYVGGRDRARSTFDRARQARRMLGSTFKPVVYAAALEAGYVEPYTLLGDTAWTLDLGAAARGRRTTTTMRITGWCPRSSRWRRASTCRRRSSRSTRGSTT
jgi:membrane peptidoglycan carboxypeptidase